MNEEKAPLEFPKNPQAEIDAAASERRKQRLNAAVNGFAWALANCPERLRVTDLSEVVYKAIVPPKQRRGKPPVAHLTIRATPKMVAQIQKEDAAERFRFLIVAIPEEAIERIESPIVLPGEV